MRTWDGQHIQASRAGWVFNSFLLTLPWVEVLLFVQVGFFSGILGRLREVVPLRKEISTKEG